MNRIRAAIPWRKKNYYDESDSTGYCTSSEISKTLSDSQFILKPSSNYYAFSESLTSSTISSAKSRDFEADSECSKSFRKNIPMMPKLTSIRHFMAENYVTENDLTTIDEITTSLEDEGKSTVGSEEEEEEEEEGTVVYEEEDIEEEEIYEEEEEDEDDDDDVTIDVPLTRKVGEFKNSSFRSFPFSYRIVESEMNKLFDMLQVDEQIASTSSGSESTRRKRLHIKEPISKIYYHVASGSESLNNTRKPKLARVESQPRGILKSKCSSFAIYEEIYGDHLTPAPIDIRPRLPDRKPIRAFDYCPTIERKKKLPSLHQSNSFASYFLRRKK